MAVAIGFCLLVLVKEIIWHNMIAYPNGLKTEGDTAHLVGLSRQVQLYYIILMELCFTLKKLISSLLFIDDS